ncbi:MAG: hypothetical protein JSS49_14480 [Planctomycetes bacterium]|nr:hypothetical protein [Planctomycetota bacterium]
MLDSTTTPCVEKQEWTQAAEKAREAAVSAGEMVGHAASAVSAMASHAASGVGRKADDLAATAGTRLQGLGDRLSQNAPQSGVLGSTSQAVVNGVKAGGKYIEDSKLTGMTEDLVELVRRNPIPAVLIAIGLGWFVGRKLGS